MIPEIPRQTIAFTHSHRERTTKELEIRVLTPAFYSRFIHYTYTSEAFDRECIFTDERNRTCWVSRPELLVQLLSQSTSAVSRSTVSESRTYLSEFNWSLLKKLRCAPAEPAYNVTPKNSEFRLEDIRAISFSDMDALVKNQYNRTYAGEYRRIVTKLFIAQRFCLGFPQIITLIDWIVRILMCYLAAQQVSGLSVSIRYSLFEQGWWPLMKSITVTTASHVYALLKGYQ